MPNITDIFKKHYFGSQDTAVLDNPPTITTKTSSGATTNPSVGGVGFGDAIPKFPAVATRLATGFASGGMAVGQAVYDISKGMTQGKSIVDIFKNVYRSKEQTFTPTSRLGKAVSETLYGTPEFTIPSLTRLAEQTPLVGDYAKKNPIFGAVAGTVLAGLDFTGTGGQANAIKALSKTSTIPDTVKIMRQIGVAEDFINDYAPIISKMKDEKGIANIVDRISNLQNNTKFTNPTVAKNLALQKAKTPPESSLIQEAKKYKTAEEFVNAQGTPKTVKVWNKSKFSNDGAYADVPVIKREDNITLYQGGSAEGRQFWTPDKKYAESFGKVTKKTGSFYQVDNGNRVTNVYVEAPAKSQLTDIWKKANEANLAKNPTLPPQTTQLEPLGEELGRVVKQPELTQKTPEIEIPQAIPKGNVSYGDSIIPDSIQSQGRFSDSYDSLDQIDLSLESLKFDKLLEGQYKNFKNLYPKFKNVEDGTQFLRKINEGKSQFVGKADDFILYSQEQMPDEVFDMFVNRYNKEKDLMEQAKQYKVDIANFKQEEKIKLGKDFDEEKAFVKMLRERKKELIGLRELRTQQKEFFDSIGAKIVETPEPKNFPAIAENANKYKDITGFKGQFRDLYRNFEQFFADKFKVAKKEILDPFDASKGRFTDDVKNMVNELETNVVKKLGIAKGSKESEALMDYGERLITYDDLVKKVGQTKADNIVEADKWFRQKYDTLLEQVNASRKQIYPNSPDKIIPKRKDYYRHFQELGGLEGIKNIFETPAGIDPRLSGISEFTKPKSKYLSFAQKRLGLGSKRDAVGGFLNYIPSWAYAKNIDPNIKQFRKLADDLANATYEAGTKNANNFIKYLQDFANDLSGKTNPADRFVQDIIPGGRMTFKALDWLNKRVKTNIILGNLSSSVAQAFNIPQGIASAKQYSLNGALRTIAGVATKDSAISKSIFINERYLNKTLTKLDKGVLNNTKKFASWITGVLDEVGTKFIWNSHYEKALAQKIDDPIKYADGITRKLVAGRGIGEVPLGQKSKLFQLVSPFQLEVGNLWYVMSDMVKEKDKVGIATLFVTTFLMNKVAEKLRGSDVSFDPLNAVYEGSQMIVNEPDKKRGVIKASGRLTGEVLSNLPLGQTLASLYPEYGFNIPGVGKMTRRELFGKGDPTRFGNKPIAIEALNDPLFKILPTYGGGQIKKTIQGIDAFMGGEVKDKGDNKLYNIPQTPLNALKTGMFGKYSTDEARQYFDRGNEPDVLKVKEIKRQEQEKKDKIEKNALKTYENIKNKPKEELKQALLILNRTDPELANKVIDLYEEEKLGLTYTDKQIKSLGVENGGRAKFIYDEIKSLPKEQKKAKLLEYNQKKILTGQVLDQVIYLFNQ